MQVYPAGLLIARLADKAACCALQAAAERKEHLFVWPIALNRSAHVDDVRTLSFPQSGQRLRGNY